MPNEVLLIMPTLRHQINSVAWGGGGVEGSGISLGCGSVGAEPVQGAPAGGLILGTIVLVVVSHLVGHGGKDWYNCQLSLLTFWFLKRAASRRLLENPSTWSLESKLARASQWLLIQVWLAQISSAPLGSKLQSISIFEKRNWFFCKYIPPFSSTLVPRITSTHAVSRNSPRTLEFLWELYCCWSIPKQVWLIQTFRRPSELLSAAPDWKKEPFCGCIYPPPSM